MKISPSNTESLQIKYSEIFHILLKTQIVGTHSFEPPRWGGSNEYPQSMFFSRNKKKICTPL